MKKQMAFLVLASMFSLCSGMGLPPGLTLKDIKWIDTKIEETIARSKELSKAIEVIRSLEETNEKYAAWINTLRATGSIYARIEKKFDSEITKNLQELRLDPNPSLKAVYILALLATPGAITTLKRYLGFSTYKAEAEKLWLSLIGKSTEKNIIDSLLKTNVDIGINVKGDQGFTALIWAVYQLDKSAVEALLKHPNINVNVKNNSGQTALDIAEKQESSDIAKLLRAKGAKKASELS